MDQTYRYIWNTLNSEFQGIFHENTHSPTLKVAKIQFITQNIDKGGEKEAFVLPFINLISR